MPHPPFARRLQKLQTALRRRRLDGFVVHDPHNIRYLTGETFSLAWLLVGPREAALVVDGRYIETARAAVDHCEVWQLETTLTPLLKRWHDAATTSEAPRYGFEGSAPWRAVQQWRDALDKNCDWIESEALLSEQRRIKSADEIRRIARSAQTTDEVFAEAMDALRPGWTERDVAHRIRDAAEAAGADGLSFDTIVATGAMSSRPHYHPADRPLRRGDLLLVDMGVTVDGYCSDMTRTVALGVPPARRLRRVYETVAEAQRAALAAVRPGAACADVDRAARECLKRHRLASRFTHGLGHGVGLEVHEAPRLGARSDDTLRAGMVVTIEPGVYLPGLGGVRIEDLVAVTRSGCRVLSRTPKEDLRVVAWEE